MIDIYRIAKDLNLKGKYGKNIYINSEGTQAFFICPFPHKDVDGSSYIEKIPSFTINLKEGKYFCFSCGERGNSITSLYKKLGVAFPSDINENNIEDSYYFSIERNSTILELYDKCLEALNKDINDNEKDMLLQYFFENRGLKITDDFIEFTGMRIIKYLDDYLIFFTDNMFSSDDDLLFVGRRVRYVNGAFQDDVRPKYYNIRKNYDFLFPFNKDNLLMLSSKYVYIVESVMDSLKLSFFGLANLCTLGSGIRVSMLDYFLVQYNYINLFYSMSLVNKKSNISNSNFQSVSNQSISNKNISDLSVDFQNSNSINFGIKYVLIPQNDDPGLDWLRSLENFFKEKNIDYSILRIPEGKKDLCELNEYEMSELFKEENINDRILAIG